MIEFGMWPVWTTYKGTKDEEKFIKAILSYEDEIWTDTFKGKVRKVIIKSMIEGKKSRFLTGLLPKVKNVIERKAGLQYKTISNCLQHSYPFKPYKLDNITLRPDQVEALIAIKENNVRGIVHAPARSGKTVTAGALISSLPERTFLFIVEGKSLFYQTAAEFKKFGFNKVQMIGDGESGFVAGYRITIAMKQTLCNIIEENKIDPQAFDIIIIDECHHVGAGKGSQYEKILTHFDTPCRIGLTATPPPDKLKHMWMEGLIGGIIHYIPPSEEKQVKPKLTVRRVPSQPSMKRLSYTEIVEQGIVYNRQLNRLVVQDAEERYKAGKSCLIVVSKVLHGMYIEELFEKFTDIKALFLCGGPDADIQRQIKELKKTKTNNDYLSDLMEIKKEIERRSKNREQFRQDIIKKKNKVVIVTAQLWGEGIDIPTLDCILLAHIGKSEIRVIQTASRPLTKSEGKVYGEIVDYFDNSNPYLISHFGERIVTYSELGWLS